MSSLAYPILSYEREADPGGEWIPMAVRMKLDLAGVKIRLPDWQALPPHCRVALLDADVESDAAVERFVAELTRLLGAVGREPPVALAADKQALTRWWRSPGAVPEGVGARLAAAGHADLWPRLNRFGRYVVVALSRKDDDPRFGAAVTELAALAASARPDAGRSAGADAGRDGRRAGGRDTSEE